MLWDVLRSSGYLSFVLTLRHGRQRRANLLKLHERAIEFEHFSTSRRSTSLGRFVLFLEKLREKERDWAPAEPDSASQNAVRVMSVHKSKGLEFPVVFLAQLGKQFNLRDTARPVVLDKDLGMGLSYTDPDDQTDRKDIIHTLIAHKKKQAALFEELRILYVALTRARERLVLTGAVKNKKLLQAVRESLVQPDQPICSAQLARCRTPIEWILYALAGRPELLEHYPAECAPFAVHPAQPENPLFTFRWHNVEDLNTLASKWILPRKPAGTQILDTAKPDPKLLQKLKASLSWQYPFQQAAQTHAKTSVTRLTHQGDESHRPGDNLGLFAKKPAILAEPKTQSPRLTGTQLGSVVHLVMEHLPLDNPVTQQTIDQTLQKLTAANRIAPHAAGHLPAGIILNFFATAPGQLLLDPKNKVHREWPFTWALPVENTPDFQIIQGIIDALIETPAGLVILDFKTDRLAPEQLQARIDIYARQVKLYAKAAQEITKLPVRSTQLCFLSLEKTIDVT